MRKFLVPLLMASVLTPAAALAQDAGFGRGDRAKSERGSEGDSSSDGRPQRAERPARAESVERSGNADGAVRMERAQRPARVERNVQQVQSTEPVQVHRIDRRQPAEPVEQVRRVERRDGGFVGGIRQVGEAQAREQSGDRDGFSGLHDRIVEHGDRVDTHHHWSSDWRHDHRYDWRGHRDHHHSLFHLGYYYDPYGWGYRRFSTGFNLWPSYYGSSFWLNDPWQYRLPPAYGPYRWVRYYDDALLVNIYTGQVVDVIYSFFW